MSTWVIGDVQGCAAVLDALLALIRRHVLATKREPSERDLMAEAFRF